MPRLGYERSDFVMGMSLAEIVLLLVFAMLAVKAARPESIDPVADCQVALDECEEQLEEVRMEVQDLRTKNEGLEQKIEWILKMCGIDVPSDATPEEIRGAAEAKKRGFKKCYSVQNELVRVRVHLGSEQLTIVELDDELAAHLRAERQEWTVGSVLEDERQIDQFLQTLRGYYEPRECRYDYRGEYATAEDYLRIREYYERFLYPAGIRKIQ